MSFPKLSLVYFAFGGRAEATRLAFFLGDVPFEDVRVPHDGFSAPGGEAAKYPYAMLPVLEVDGVAIAESMAMLRFAGWLAGLYPANDPIAGMLIDEVLELIEVFTEKCLRWERESDVANQRVLENELTATVIPQSFYDIDAKLRTLRQHPTFAESSNLFIHDLVLRSFVRFIIRPDWERFIPDRTKIAHWLERIDIVESHPQVRLYYAVKEQRERAAAKPLKLTDVDSATSLGESIRLAFAFRGIEFDDERVAPSSLPELKLTLGDGREITKFFAVLRYAGTLSGLYPAGQDPLLSFKIDELLAQLEELQNQWYLPAFAADDVAKQQQVQQRLVDMTIPKFLAQLDRRVGSWAKPFATGSTLTIADLAIFGIVNQLRAGQFIRCASKGPTVDVDKYGNLLKICVLVESHPSLRPTS